MNKFLLLTKINLLRIFDFKKVVSSKYKNERRKNIFKVILSLFIIFYLSYYIYDMVNTLIPGFISLNKPIYVLGLMFSVISVFIFFHNLFKVKAILFDFKDYELLNSMPIKRNIIILSKLVSVYLLNLLYTFMVMIPSFIVYSKYLNVSFGFIYFILLFIIPIVPMLLSFIFGIILSWLTSFFKNKNIGSYIIYLTLIFVVMFISFKMNNMDSIMLANSGISIIDKVNRIYPLTNIFINLLTSFKVIDLICLMLIPCLLSCLFIIIINHFYITIRTRLLKSNIKDDYKVKVYHYNNPLISLYKKELRKFISNPLYILNTVFGCILLIVFMLLIIIFNDNTLASYLKIDNLGEFLKKNSIFVISMCCALSSTTFPSISLEGKNFWIIKMIPISTKKIFLSKIMVNLSVLIPTIIIGGTFFGIYLHLDLVNFVLIYLMPLMYAIFISCLGLLYNLLFPKFDFENEIKVIKQSLAAFLTMFSGIISVIIPLIIKSINMIIITLVIFIINIFLIIILNTYGEKRMKAL